MSSPSLAAGDLERLLALCEHDAGAKPASATVRRNLRHYKSQQIYVSADGSGTVSHVAKLEWSRWDPAREYGGLRFVEAAVSGDPGLGALHPVACSATPPLLLTRFQEGAEARACFDRAVWWPSSRRGLAEARHCVTGMAHWLAVLRRAGKRPAAGLSTERLQREIRERCGEIEAFLGAGGVAKHACTVVALLLESASEQDLHRLSDAFPTHGDLAPQNFLITPGGRLVGLDLEGFRFSPGNPDLYALRTRFEHYALWSPWTRSHATLLWRAFLEAYSAEIGREESSAFFLLSYLHKILAQLAWQRHPDHLAREPHMGRLHRIRVKLWIRSRLQWLGDLCGDPRRDFQRFSQQL